MLVVRWYSLGCASHCHCRGQPLPVVRLRVIEGTCEPCLSPRLLLSLWLCIRFLSLLVQGLLILRSERNSFVRLICLSNYRKGSTVFFILPLRKKIGKEYMTISWKMHKSKKVFIYTHNDILNFTLLTIIWIMIVKCTLLSFRRLLHT